MSKTPNSSPWADGVQAYRDNQVAEGDFAYLSDTELFSMPPDGLSALASRGLSLTALREGILIHPVEANEQESEKAEA